MTTILKTVGANIRRLRKARNLTLEKLAETSESNPKYLGGVERGEENISVITLDRVAVALQVKSYELLLPFEAGSMAEHLEGIIRAADTETQTLIRDVLERIIQWKELLVSKRRHRLPRGRK